MKTFHVAAAQIHSGGTVSETLKRMERQVRSAVAVGAEVILFSECVLQGYDYGLTPEILAGIAEPADSPNVSKVVAMAQRHGLIILAGFYERDGAHFHNSLLIARSDGSFIIARKHALERIEHAAGLIPGPRERTVIEINGVRIAILICADLGIKGLNGMLKKQRVNYRFSPTAGGGKIADMLQGADLQTSKGRAKYEENRPQVFKAEAILSQKDCPLSGITSANALGPVGRKTCHQGHCLIVDNQRVIRAQIPGTIVLEHQQDQMIHAILDFP